MSLPPPGQPRSSKSTLRTFGLVLLIIAAAVGAGFAWQKYRSRPLSVAETRKVIREYLEVKAGVRRFEPASVMGVATNQPGADPSFAAGDEANSRKSEKKKKKKIHPPHEQLARNFRRSVKDSADYRTTYLLIGENLAGVDEWLASPDQERTEAAVALAAGAARAALDPAVDGWLAARIAEAYLWPNLDKVPPADKSGIDAASLLDICEDAFDAADETENLVQNYRLLISRGDQPGKTDKFRVRLAKLLESQDNFTEALRVLRQVQDTNNPSLARRISGVEMMLQQSKSAH